MLCLLCFLLQKAESCKGSYTSASPVHGEEGTKAQADMMLGLAYAGIGISQHQSGGTSRARRSQWMLRSRRRGRPARQSRRCRSSWQASGARRPSGVPAGAQAAALLRVCCASDPHGGTASLHGRDCLCACLLLQDWPLIFLLLVALPMSRLAVEQKLHVSPSGACTICNLAKQPEFAARN